MPTTLSNYIHAALAAAEYEFDPETKVWVASIAPLPGVVAQADSVEAAREQLTEVVEDWILVSLQFGDEIPTLDGLTLPRVSRANSPKLAHA